MSIEILRNMVQTGQWAALALIVLTLANTWLSKESRFPVTAPAWLRPLLVIVLGQGMAVVVAIAAHQAYAMVAVHAVLASIVAIGTSHSIWSGSAPSWMQDIAGIAEAVDVVIDAGAKGDVLPKAEEPKAEEKKPEEKMPEEPK